MLTSKQVQGQGHFPAYSKAGIKPGQGQVKMQRKLHNSRRSKGKGQRIGACDPLGWQLGKGGGGGEGGLEFLPGRLMGLRQLGPLWHELKLELLPDTRCASALLTPSQRHHPLHRSPADHHNHSIFAILKKLSLPYNQDCPSVKPGQNHQHASKDLNSHACMIAPAEWDQEHNN